MSDAPILGIDLGTTCSTLSYIDAAGTPHILPNACGGLHTPSVVHFRSDGSALVGEPALAAGVVDPLHTARCIKPHRGEDKPLSFYGQSYQPQELEALLLHQLKDDAQGALGGEIRDVVLTVPAWYEASQRGATAEAGAIAGLNVVSVINEPTAAAIPLGFDRHSAPHTLLVLDAGGGSFDVTVLQAAHRKLITLACDGNASLGGHAWDERLVHHVAEHLREVHRVDPRTEPASRQALVERCVAAKVALSTEPHAVIAWEHQRQRLSVEVDRPLFELLTHDLVVQCEDRVHQTLERAGVRWQDLDDLLLVGRASQMPMLRDRLPKRASRATLHSIDPDTAVAIGAAWAGVYRHRPHHPALRRP